MRGVYIMLTYNGGDLPLNAIDSIMAYDGANVPIILVDNGSNFQYSSWLWNNLRKLDFCYLWEGEPFEKLRGCMRILYRLKRNRLFAGGNRKGLGLALKLGYDFGIFTNDDILLKSPMMGAVCEIFERYSDIGIVGPNVLQAGLGLNLTNLQEIYYPEIIFFKLVFGAKVAGLVREFVMKDLEPERHPSGGFVVPWVPGAFFGARLRPLHDGMALRYRRFLGGEEYEMSETMRRQGYKTVFYPYMGRVVHLGGETIKKGRIVYSKYVWGDIESFSRLYGLSGARRAIFVRLLAAMLYELGLTPVGFLHKIRDMFRER